MNPSYPGNLAEPLPAASVFAARIMRKRGARPRGTLRIWPLRADRSIAASSSTSPQNLAGTLPKSCRARLGVERVSSGKCLVPRQSLTLNTDIAAPRYHAASSIPHTGKCYQSDTISRARVWGRVPRRILSRLEWMLAALRASVGQRALRMLGRRARLALAFGSGVARRKRPRARRPRNANPPSATSRAPRKHPPGRREGANREKFTVSPRNFWEQTTANVLSYWRISVANQM